MMLRSVKRKRKHQIDKNNEESDDSEKYKAYIKKPSKKDNKEKNTCSPLTQDNAKLALKKGNKKKNSDSQVVIPTEVISTVAPVTSKVTICAKPKLNKFAVESNIVHKTDSKVNGKLTKNKKRVLNKKLLKMQKKEKTSSNDEVEIKVISPEINLSPTIVDDEPNTSILLQTLSLKINDDASTESAPIIIEANLKKSSNSYVPKALQDPEEIIGTNEISNKKDNKNKSSEKPVDNAQNNDQELNCNIPKELQEFYDEVTKSFSDLTENQKSNKSKKKNTPLTVDKSLTDSNDLMNIVHRNNSLFNKSVSVNHESVAQFFSLETKVILVLHPGKQFSFSGKLKLRVLYGAIELYGSVFDCHNTIKPVEVYSPRGYSSISISNFNVSNTYDKEALWDTLTSEGVDRSLKTKLHNAIQECKPGWTVLLLENLENTLTNFLSAHCSFKLFPKIENIKYSWCDSRRAECVLQANFQFHHYEDEISIGPCWNDSITNQLLAQWKSKNSVCALIAGGKGVGKSTTARYLINNLLRHSKKVVLLDLDPGQAELTPAACLSINILEEPLLGPNFTHLKTPFYQLYLEDVNVTNCITKYIQYTKKLVDFLKNHKDLAQYPVIVNTMGFCKGLGLDICIFLIKLIEPTNIIQILSKRTKNNFEFALLKHTVNERKTSLISLNDDEVFKKICDYELHYIPSMAEGKRQFETWNIEPRQQRELVLLAYLSQIIQNADEKCFCNFTPNSINNVIPYTLPFSSFYVSLMHASIPPTHILAAMNGNIVALCGIDLDEDSSNVDKESLNYPLVVIKPPTCTCYGYGIVRGIDMKKRCVYINTPLDQNLLQYVNLLTGCSAMPFALLNPGKNSNAPYAADRGELPTSREARRGNFRVDQNKSM